MKYYKVIATTNIPKLSPIVYGEMTDFYNKQDLERVIYNVWWRKNNKIKVNINLESCSEKEFNTFMTPKEAYRKVQNAYKQNEVAMIREEARRNGDILQEKFAPLICALSHLLEYDAEEER